MKKSIIMILTLFFLGIFVFAGLNEDLFDSVKNGNISKVKELINKGANVKAKDNNGNTPLHIASASGYLDVVEFLIEKGAKVNAKNKDGDTPLHLAADNGYLEIIKLLIDKGADVNALNKKYETPMEKAKIKEYDEIAEYLKSKGAKEESLFFKIGKLYDGMIKVIKDNKDDPKKAGEAFTKYIKDNKDNFKKTFEEGRKKYGDNPDPSKLSDTDKKEYEEVSKKMAALFSDTDIIKVMSDPEFQEAAKEGNLIFSEILISDQQKITNENSSTKDDINKTIITFWHKMNPQETKTLQEIVDNFEKENPNIKVKMEVLYFEEAQKKFEGAASIGTAPDVFRAEIAWMPALANMGYLAPLEDYIHDTSDFLDAPLKYNKFNDRLWGIPQVTDCLALFYNKKIFEKAGIKEPPKTLDELIKCANIIVEKKAAKIGFYMRGDSYWFQPFLWAFGGNTVSNDKKIQINSPESVKSLEFFVNKFLKAPGVKKNINFNSDYTDAMEAFKSGDAGMILNGPWSIRDVLYGAEFKNNIDNLGIAIIPGNNGLQGSPVGGHNYVIYKATKNMDASVKFICYLSKTENQVKFALNNMLLPTRKSAYETEELMGNRIIQDFVKQLQVSTNRPVIPEAGLPIFYSEFTKYFQKAWEGKMKPKKALNAIAKEWEKIGLEKVYK